MTADYLNNLECNVLVSRDSLKISLVEPSCNRYYALAEAAEYKDSIASIINKFSRGTGNQ